MSDCAPLVSSLAGRLGSGCYIPIQQAGVLGEPFPRGSLGASGTVQVAGQGFPGEPLGGSQQRSPCEYERASSV